MDKCQRGKRGEERKENNAKCLKELRIYERKGNMRFARRKTTGKREKNKRGKSRGRGKIFTVQ